jgi:hypothetical protein
MAESEEISIIDEIERLSQAEAFRPFSIIMTSGTRYDIGEGHAVALGSSVITIASPNGTQQLLRQNQISELHIPEVAE